MRASVLCAVVLKQSSFVVSNALMV